MAQPPVIRPAHAANGSAHSHNVGHMLGIRVDLAQESAADRVALARAVWQHRGLLQWVSITGSTRGFPQCHGVVSMDQSEALFSALC
jgi:hypothetical protein